MHLREHDIEALCSNLVHDHGLGLPLDPWELCRRLGRSRHRPITVSGAPLGGPFSIGHLIALPAVDTIFYDVAAPYLLRVQVICHEVLHLVLGHLDGATSLSCGALLPVESPPMAGSPANLYNARQEWEAEVGATVLARLATARASSDVDAADDPGLSAAFGLRRGERE